MKFSFETETLVDIDKIWNMYSDVNNWFKWESDLEDISLSGQFVQGTKGTMKLKGQPEMSFELVKVENNSEFTDLTVIPHVGEISFIHQLISKDDKIVVKHSVELVPDNRLETFEDSRFVGKIFKDVPNSVFGLVKAANEL